MTTDYGGFVPTNVRIYFAIVQDSIKTIDECHIRDVRPKPDGSHGNVIRLDPQRTSFKNAFIAIVFAGVYLEALFHILIGQRLGVATAKRLDKKNYEDKATALGLLDTQLHSDLARYRRLRKEIVHEKAHFDLGEWRVAQDEAHFAFDLIRNVQAALGVDVQSDLVVE